MILLSTFTRSVAPIMDAPSSSFDLLPILKEGRDSFSPRCQPGGAGAETPIRLNSSTRKSRPEGGGLYSRTAGGHGCPLAAILCGGRSRRMGRDKALLPHPCGGSLLQHTCALALATGLETICLSRPDQGHRQHLATVPALRQVTVLEECPPWEGPLLALAKLMTTYPGHPMLLLACDLPNLTPPLLNAIAAPLPPHHARLATDGEQQQPLLASYGADLAAALHQAVAAGVRSFREWLPGLPVEWLRVSSTALVNLNRLQDLATITHATKHP